MLDFRLKTFLVLCKVMNYTKTAEILHITQPAVSQHIKFLEEDFQVKLFIYKDKNLTLTQAGEILYNFALAMQASSDRTRLLMSLPKATIYPIHFGTTLTIGEYTMPELLEKAALDFPSAHIMMEVNNTEVLLEKLHDGKIDFALLEGHFDKSKYHTMLFSLERFIGVCSPTHPLAKRKLSFHNILQEQLILREQGSGSREIFEQILYEHNASMNSFKNIMQIGNISVIKKLVSKNLGITFLYKEAVKKELSTGNLSVLDIEDFTVEREFNFVFLKDSLHRKEYTRWFDYFISNRNLN